MGTQTVDCPSCGKPNSIEGHQVMRDNGTSNAGDCPYCGEDLSTLVFE